MDAAVNHDSGMSLHRLPYSSRRSPPIALAWEQAPFRWPVSALGWPDIGPSQSGVHRQAQPAHEKQIACLSSENMNQLRIVIYDTVKVP